MKRSLCLLLALCLLIGSGVLHPGAFAAPEVVFTVINNVLVGNLQTETMPAVIDGEGYLPYAAFNRLSNVFKFAYNEQQQVLMAYNPDGVLYFDLANDITYDDARNTMAQTAFLKNGTVYVPVAAVGRKFGLTVSLITGSALGPVIRINSETPAYSDSVLLEALIGSMTREYTAYLERVNTPLPPPENPGPGTEVPGTDPTAPGTSAKTPAQIIFPVFMGDIGGISAQALELFDEYGYRATFFFSAEQMINEADLLRELYAEGHSIGLRLGAADSAGALEGQIVEANRTLGALLRTRTRLVAYAPGEGAALTEEQQEVLVEQGCRLWEETLDPASADNLSTNARIQRFLSRQAGSAVLRLALGEEDLDLCRRLFDALAGGRYDVQPIQDWHTPINSLKLIR